MTLKRQLGKRPHLSREAAINKFTHQLPGMVYQLRLYPNGRTCFPYVSDAVAGLFRLSPEQVRLDASAVFDKIHPEDRDSVVASMRQSALALSPWQHEYRVQFEDGTVHWLFGNALPEREASGATLWHGFTTNITVKKEAEKQARSVLNRLKVTLDAIPDLLFEMSLEGQYLDFHSTRPELLMWPVAELLGRFVHKMLPANAATTILDALQEAHAKGHSDGRIYSLPLSKGTTWFELSVARKATEPSEAPRFIVLSRDITERVHSQEKNFLSGLALSAISQGVLISDPQGRLISCNKGFTGITGFEEADVLGQLCDFLLGPLTDPDAVAACQAAQLRQEAFKGQLLNYRKDGSTFWSALSVTPILACNGELLHFVRIMQDITQQKIAEEEVMRSNAEERRLNASLRMFRLFDNLIAHALDKDQLLNGLCKALTSSERFLMAWVGLAATGTGTVEAIEPAAYYSREGDSFVSIKAAWALERARGVGATVLAIQTAKTQMHTPPPGDPTPPRWLKEGARPAPYATLSIPFLDGTRLLGVLVIHSRKAEAFNAAEVVLLEDLAQNIVFGLNAMRVRQELACHQTQLERLVIARTLEVDMLNENLRKEKREADTANRAKSDFLSNMSHELRTPLNVVVGLTGLLTQSPLNQRQAYYAEKIQLSATTLRMLIDDILDFSKIEANELQLEKAPFSLHGLLINIASVLGVSVGLKPIEAVLDVAVDVPDKLFGDAMRLQQILLNLISNAVKFTEKGEIVLTVRCLTSPAALPLCAAALEFCLRDTGIGMTADTQKLIFNSFTQAHESTSRLYGGTGLGLTISKRLASLMQGQLDVQSALGQWTAFRLTLPFSLDRPVSAPAPAHVPALLAPPHPPLHLRVLVVDDHPLVRDLLTQTGRQWGWQTEAVGSGAAALQALNHRGSKAPVVDLLLLDWRMPGMDGLEMLRQLYKSPSMALPRVVLMVATAEIEQAIIASAEFNIDGIIAKPLTPSRLLRTVSKAFMSDVELVDTKPQENKTPLLGLRLLVAEDNALNQEVIEQILINAGAQVVLVSNGLAALAALQMPGPPFDGVLMDVQMPVMDGYTATQRMRETLGLLDLPIIALTAYVRPQDREKSRLAGMSGHLTKPLDVQDLFGLLAKTRAVPVSQPEATLSWPAELSLPGLDVAEGLKMFANRPERYGQLLHQFMAQQGRGAVEARRCVAEGRLEEAANLLHDLSGVAGFLQARELSRLAAAAQAALLGETTENLLVLLDDLQAALDTVTAALVQLDAATAAS